MFLLHLSGKTALYEQIREQIARLIEAGVVKPGDRLPSIRQLARENGLNPNTVARAYGELEKTGYLHNIPKKGVYVAEVDLSAQKEKQMMEVLSALKEAGIQKDELIRVLDCLYEEDGDVED